MAINKTKQVLEQTTAHGDLLILAEDAGLYCVLRMHMRTGKMRYSRAVSNYETALKAYDAQHEKMQNLLK